MKRVIKISNPQHKISKLKLLFNKLKSKSSNQNDNLEITEIYKTNDINPIDKTIDTNTTDVNFIDETINTDTNDKKDSFEISENIDKNQVTSFSETINEVNILDSPDPSTEYFIGNRNLLIKVEKSKFEYPILKSVTLFSYANLPILQNLDVTEKTVKYNTTLENVCPQPIPVVVEYKQVTLKPYISYSVALYNDKPYPPISNNCIDGLDIHVLENDSFLGDSFILCLPLNSPSFKAVDFLVEAVTSPTTVSPLGEIGDYYFYEVNVDFHLKPAPPVEVTDESTVEALNKALGRPEGSTDPFTRGELESITTLDLSGGVPEDFSVLQYTPNLTSLDISKTNATDSDLSYVGNLPNLEVLVAQENNITDISALSNLFKLKSLDLSNPNVSTFSVKAASQNMISDINPLADLTELSYLNLSGNIIVDVLPLSSLINLEHLDLSYNLITDISPLSNLMKLSYLNISVNKISDISHLINLTATIDVLSQTIDLGTLIPTVDDTFMLELDFLKGLHGFVPCIDFISDNGSCYEGESCDCSTIVWEDIDVSTDAYFNFSDDSIFSGVVNVTLVPNPS